MLEAPFSSRPRRFRGLERLSVCGWKFDLWVNKLDTEGLEFSADCCTGVRQRGQLVGLKVQAVSHIGLSWLLTLVENGIRKCLRQINEGSEVGRHQERNVTVEVFGIET